jgi:hypothetical protein
MINMGSWLLYCLVTLKVSVWIETYMKAFLWSVLLPCTLFTGSGGSVKKNRVQNVVLLVALGKLED